MRRLQALASRITGYLPLSLARSRAASSSADLRSASSARPLLAKDWPQHRLLAPSGTMGA